MADDKNLTQVNAAAAVSDTDLVPVVQSGTAIRRATVGQTRTWAQPLGRSGTGTVPAGLKERFRHVANAKTDFGVQLYNNATDDGGGLKDNRAALQAAIDAVQPFGGAIFIPPDERSQSYVIGGGLTLRDSDPSYRYKSVGLVGIRPGDWTRGLRNSFLSAPNQFSFGVNIKLADQTNAHLLTSPPLAGHLYLEDIGFDANEFAQTGDWRAINIEDAPSAPYAFGVITKNVNVINAGSEGAFVGVNRGMTLLEDLWVQYCGRANGAAGVNIRTYDVQIIRPGIGMNRGPGLFLGGTAQFEMQGGALWDNQTNMVVGSSAMTVNVVGTHFDGALEHNLAVSEYTADERPAARTFTSCMFSRRPNAYVNNTFDDIATSCTRLVLVAPMFQGNATTTPVTSTTKRSRWAINHTTSTARTVCIGELIDLTAVSGGGFRSVFTGFTNEPDQIIRMGPINTYSNRFNGNFEVRTRANFDYWGMVHDDGTFVAAISSGTGGKHGLVRTWDGSGNLVFAAGNQSSVRARWTDLPVFANDTAAGAAGLLAGELYVNSSTRAVTSKS